MIRTEAEYQEVRNRFVQDIEDNEALRKQYAEEGLTAEELEKAMQPLQCFHAQISDELSWYENVCRGNFTPTKRLTDLGRLLIASRIAKGWSQKELAQALGVSEPSVSRDEKNEYHGITLERAQRILDALEVSTTTTVDNLVARMATNARVQTSSCTTIEDDNGTSHETANLELVSM